MSVENLIEMPVKSKNTLGYKETELGWIPEDWSIKKLDELISENPTYGINASATAFSDYLPTYLRITDISENGKFINEKKSSVNHPFSGNYILEEGDMVFARTGASVGKTYLYNKFDGTLVYAGFLIKVKANKKRLNPLYLKFITETNSYWSWVKVMSMRSGQPGINGNEYKKLLIPLPPTIEEQTAIATALIDMDGYISSLEKLIAKKRLIKQGAMQELLTPKEDWEVKKLGEIADPNIKWSFTGGPFGSNLKSSDYTEDGVRVIQLQNIGDGQFFNDSEIFTSVEKANDLLSCNIYPGDIILSKMGDPVARACIIPDYHKRYLMCSDGIRLAVNRKNFDSYFIYLTINNKKFRSLAENNSTGSTRKRIGLSQLRNLELKVPSLKEQQWVSSLVLQMSKEISSLEIKHTKAKQIKQGMMQELLTGRIRLV